MRRRAWSALACAASMLVAAGARAQPAPRVREDPWALSLTLGGGAMVSADQIEDLHLEGGGTGRFAMRFRPLDTLGVDWIEGSVSVGLTLVGPGREALGGVADVLLGARIAPRVGDLRPYLSIDAGVGSTGRLVRAVGSAAIGLAIPFGDEITLGPEVGLVHVVQDDGPRQSDDAVFLFTGVTLAYRHVTRAEPPQPDVPPARERVVVMHDREVVERRVVAPPLPPPPQPPLVTEELLALVDRAVPGSTLRVVLLVPPILFDHDQAVLTAAGEVAMHDVLERVAEAPAEARIVIEGHADRTGDLEHNLRLSRERARVVGDWLADHGVPRAIMREVGEGAARPIVIGEDTESLAPNRRVTIRIEAQAAPEEGAR